MKKGFTLIELLAVIVILAIIALIATPIILGIINDAKVESNQRSAELYLSGVELAIARKNLTEEFNPEICEIQSGGNLICDEYEEPLKVEVDGKIPMVGSTIKFDKNEPTEGTKLKFEEFTASINESGELKIEDASSEETEESTPVVTYNPQYYGYIKQGENTVIGESLAPENPSIEPPEGKSTYVGYDVTDGIITEGYVCFVKDGAEYCLKGNDPEAYETNKTMLEETCGAVEGTVGFGTNAIVCNVDGMEVYTTNYGAVSAGKCNISCFDSCWFACFD